MAHTYINGFGGSIVFGGATLDVDSWSLNVNGEAVDTTNTGDGNRRAKGTHPPGAGSASKMDPPQPHPFQ